MASHLLIFVVSVMKMTVNYEKFCDEKVFPVIRNFALCFIYVNLLDFWGALSPGRYRGSLMNRLAQTFVEKTHNFLALTSNGQQGL